MGIFLSGEEEQATATQKGRLQASSESCCLWTITIMGDRGYGFTATPSIETITGYPSDLFNYREAFDWPQGLWFQTIHSEDRVAYHAAWQGLERGEPLSIRYRIVRLKGEVRWVESQAMLTRGRGAHIHGVLIDITNRMALELDQRQLEAGVQQGALEWRLMFDAVESPILILDLSGRVQRMNRAARALLGPTRANPAGRKVETLGSGEPWNQIAQLVESLAGEQQCGPLEARDVASGRVWEISASLFTGSGMDRLITVVARDVTERKQGEEALRQREERFRSLIENASDMITILGGDGGIRYESPSVDRILGYQPEEMVGRSAFDYIHPEDRLTVMNAFLYRAQHTKATPSLEFRIRHKDGTWRTLDATANNRLSDPAILGIVINCRDITERKHIEEQLLHDALHDALTGLPNRALFMDRLAQSIRHSKRRDRYRFAVLFVDLDRFKIINDSLGHMLGDQLLIAIARRLEECLRSTDTIARHGGDEFTILLDDIEDPADAIAVADAIQKELSLPFSLGGHIVYTTASMGIALGEADYDRPEDVLRDADTAMYRAKAQGKSCHRVFDKGMHARVVEALKLESDLWQSIERRQFVLFYQPIVELDQCKLIGFEALLRWRHPQRGLVLPGDFIEVAEETKMIIPIGKWVLNEACHQLAVWQREFDFCNSLSVSVNLSGRQLIQPGFVGEIEAALTNSGISPDNLKLEITESVFMENAESTISQVLRLKAMGVQLQIDDFGTGYSSLSYLHRFPIDSLKIDRSFITRMGSSGKNSEIVRTILALARNLGISVIAEGIETLEQLRELRLLECRYGQGHLFAEALGCELARDLIASDSTLDPASSWRFSGHSNPSRRLRIVSSR